jgi:NADH-quinone oxidoreductase subunit M
MGLLSTLIWLPILGGVVILAVGDRGARPDRWLALLFSIATFVLSISLYSGFDFSTPGMQFVERAPWIQQFNIQYFLGVDGISTPLILLSTFLTPMIIVAGWEVIKTRPAQYMAAFLILEGLMIGVFTALDAMLF